MKESALQKRFIDILKQEKDFWHFKVHGHIQQRKGVPDLLVCCDGKFIAIEFKIKRKGHIEITPLQEHELDKIASAKGFAVIIYYDEKDSIYGCMTKMINPGILWETTELKSIIDYIRRVA